MRWIAQFWLSIVRLLHWFESTVLGSEEWAFDARGSADQFLHIIEQQVHPAPRSAFIVPWDYSRVGGLRGHVEGSCFWIKMNPPRLSIRSLLASSQQFAFIGTVHETNGRTVVRGRYRYTTVVRAMILTWSYLVLGGGTASLVYVLVAVHAFEPEKALIASATSAVCLSLLFLLRLYNKIVHFINSPYRDQLHAFLAEAAAGESG